MQKRLLIAHPDVQIMHENAHWNVHFMKFLVLFLRQLTSQFRFTIPEPDMPPELIKIFHYTIRYYTKRYKNAKGIDKLYRNGL